MALYIWYKHIAQVTVREVVQQIPGLAGFPRVPVKLLTTRIPQWVSEQQEEGRPGRGQNVTKYWRVSGEVI